MSLRPGCGCDCANHLDEIFACAEDTTTPNFASMELRIEGLMNSAPFTGLASATCSNIDCLVENINGTYNMYWRSDYQQFWIDLGTANDPGDKGIQVSGPFECEFECEEEVGGICTSWIEDWVWAISASIACEGTACESMFFLQDVFLHVHECGFDGFPGHPEGCTGIAGVGRVGDSNICWTDASGGMPWSGLVKVQGGVFDPDECRVTKMVSTADAFGCGWCASEPYDQEVTFTALHVTGDA